MRLSEELLLAASISDAEMRSRKNAPKEVRELLRRAAAALDAAEAREASPEDHTLIPNDKIIEASSLDPVAQRALRDAIRDNQAKPIISRAPHTVVEQFVDDTRIIPPIIEDTEGNEP